MFVNTPCLTTLLLVAQLLLANAPGTAQVPAPLRVDRSQYAATCLKWKDNTCSYTFIVVASYENLTTDTLYLSRCDPTDPTPRYSIEAVDDTTQDVAYDPVWACAGHDHPIVVAPHAARVDTLRIEGPNSVNAQTHVPLGKFEGEFRLLYKVSSCRSGRSQCQRLPDLERSGTFRVHLVH